MTHASLEFFIFLGASRIIQVHNRSGIGLDSQGTGRHLQRHADIRADLDQFENFSFIQGS